MLKKFAVVALLVLTPFIYGGRAGALSCAMPEITVEQNIRDKEYIFLGTYIGGQTISWDEGYADVRVTKVFKGTMTDVVRIKTNMWTGLDPKAGEDRLFLFNSGQFNRLSGSFTREMCDFHDVLTPEDDNFDTYMAALDGMQGLLLSRTQRYLLMTGVLAALCLTLVATIVLIRKKLPNRRKK